MPWGQAGGIITVLTWCYDTLDLLSCHNINCKALQCGNGISSWFRPAPHSVWLGPGSCWVWLFAEWSAWWHLWCGCSRGGLSLQHIYLYNNTQPRGYIWILARKGVWGMCRLAWLIPFHLSQLILELATHCSGRVEVVGWCVCAHMLVPSYAEISSWGHLGSREGRQPWDS